MKVGLGHGSYTAIWNTAFAFQAQEEKGIEKRKQQCYRVVTTHDGDLGRLSIYIHTYTYSLEKVS